MNTRKSFSLLILTLLTPLALAAAPASAQSYSITWSTIDCGGGNISGTDPLSGAAFALSSTIGQHDAGVQMTGLTPSGSSFSVSGGFWPTTPSTVVPTCPADFNHDGTLDPDDLADYITAFFTQPPSPAADFNADGITDPDDLADYITAFFNGCP